MCMMFHHVAIYYWPGYIDFPGMWFVCQILMSAFDGQWYSCAPPSRARPRFPFPLPLPRVTVVATESLQQAVVVTESLQQAVVAMESHQEEVVVAVLKAENEGWSTFFEE
ncbi:hypothetical protein ACFXTO_031035 [Malus domestica]